MIDHEHREPMTLSRRQLLLGSGVLAGAVAAGGAAAGASTALGPTGHLRASDSRTVNPAQFVSERQLRSWQGELDALGMRATGTPVHEHFIDTLMARLSQAGVQHVHSEPVPIQRWSAQQWALAVDEGPHAGALATASYLPYAGGTPADGVTGELAVVLPGGIPAPGSLTGKVALYEMPVGSIAYSLMETISYGKYDPHGLLTPTGEYSRPWTGVGDLITLLDALDASGAVGAIGIIDLPAGAAHGSYFPYDGTIRTVPGVFVDQATGAKLQSLSLQGTTVRLTVRSTVEHMMSRNVVGLIPGRSDEYLILNSHTDGPNGVEDNGPNSIIAMANYLSRLPKDALPRTIMISFTTGHFHGGIGQVTFARQHRDTTLRRAACAITLEHLGALAWDEKPDGTMGLSGQPELGVLFVPENKAMVDAALAAITRARAGPALALRPYVSVPGAPNGYGWPGEGTQLWSDGHVMTMNYITGPTYLLNWGIPTVDKCDFALMRREVISFTQMVLDLGHVPAASLSALDLTAI